VDEGELAHVLDADLGRAEVREGVGPSDAGQEIGYAALPEGEIRAGVRRLADLL